MKRVNPHYVSANKELPLSAVPFYCWRALIHQKKGPCSLKQRIAFEITFSPNRSLETWLKGIRQRWEWHLRVLWARSSTKVFFFLVLLMSSLSIGRYRCLLYMESAETHSDENKHFCKSCRLLRCTFKGVCKPLVTELVFCTLAHNMTVFSFRGKSSIVFPLSDSLLLNPRPIKSRSRLSSATCEKWKRTLSFKTQLQQQLTSSVDSVLRIFYLFCGVRISDRNKTTLPGKTRQVKCMEWCSSLS